MLNGMLQTSNEITASAICWAHGPSLSILVCLPREIVPWNARCSCAGVEVCGTGCNTEMSKIFIPGRCGRYGISPRILRIQALDENLSNSKPKSGFRDWIQNRCREISQDFLLQGKKHVSRHIVGLVSPARRPRRLRSQCPTMKISCACVAHSDSFGNASVGESPRCYYAIAATRSPPVLARH